MTGVACARTEATAARADHEEVAGAFAAGTTPVAGATIRARAALARFEALAIAGDAGAGAAIVLATPDTDPTIARITAGTRIVALIAAEYAVAETSEVATLPGAASALDRLAALAAGRGVAAAEVRTLVNSVGEGFVARVGEAIASLGGAWVDVGVGVIAIISRDDAVTVVIGRTRDAQTCLADLSSVGAHHSRTKIIGDAQPLFAVGTLLTHHAKAGAIDEDTFSILATRTSLAFRWAEHRVSISISVSVAPSVRNDTRVA